MNREGCICKCETIIVKEKEAIDLTGTGGEMEGVGDGRVKFYITIVLVYYILKKRVKRLI